MFFVFIPGRERPLRLQLFNWKLPRGMQRGTGPRRMLFHLFWWVFTSVQIGVRVCVRVGAEWKRSGSGRRECSREWSKWIDMLAFMRVLSVVLGLVLSQSSSSSFILYLYYILILYFILLLYTFILYLSFIFDWFIVIKWEEF